MAQMIVDLETGTVLGIHPDILIVDEDRYINAYDYPTEAMEALIGGTEEAHRVAEEVGVSLSDTFEAHRRMAHRVASTQTTIESAAKDFMAYGWNALYNDLPEEVRSKYALINPFTGI